ncbi:hypothetical protein [Actinacidiphila rubida]|uniref:ABC-2 family transporter protein n=1 Tax=Actinacidiphila rubida TaxID=310780 RepID=A0A1H8SSJ5_9ACTN|nr:hypothetical protein [Actinacidiphila rubida]SEO81929.1 hypothetical protein SAMN05216267_104549 [Actinacidiphila rubida]
MSPLTGTTRAEPGTGDPPVPLLRDGGGLAGLAWLTWRQHRWALVTSLVVSAALAAWMLWLAADMTGVFHQCHDTICPEGSPQQARLSAPFGPVNLGDKLLLGEEYVPLLIGVFLGVPLLAREFEQRTLLLAWSQDVSPMRWMWTRLLLLGLVVAALTAGVSAAAGHLARVLHDVGDGSMFQGQLFLDSGMLPLAAGLSWFVVGAALGAAVRRVLPAALAVVAGFVAALVAVDWRYPWLVAPVSRFLPFAAPGSGTPLGANPLVIQGGIQIGPPDHVVNVFDAAHRPVTFPELNRWCPNVFQLGGEDSVACFTRNGLTHHVVYQPGSRIPEFHLLLASGYTALGLLALAAVWLVVRRTALSAG